MPRPAFETLITTCSYTIRKNGAMRVRFDRDRAYNSFQCEWAGPDGVAEAGQIILSYDGNYVDEATLDMSIADKGFAFNQPLHFIDIEVSQLPVGGEIVLHCSRL